MSEANHIKIEVKDLDFFYGSFKALSDISVEFRQQEITALIGPSGCGKSTFLRCLNRMNDEIDGARVDGELFIDGLDIYGPSVDVVELRRRVGMVFQKPNPFPQSVFDNVAFGPRVLGLEDGKGGLEALVERSLTRPRSGVTSKTISVPTHFPCRLESSKDYVSRECSRSSRKSF